MKSITDEVYETGWVDGFISGLIIVGIIATCVYLF